MFHVIWTDDSYSDLVIRIRQKNISDSGGDEEEEGNRLLQKLMTYALAAITLRGVSGINKVFMREERLQKYDPYTGVFNLEPQWVLDTDGCNLKDVLGMGGDIDQSRTTSNKITEVYDNLGVEATRRALMKELHNVLSFDGSYVNHRHLSILCDVMTQRGKLTSITRNGINRVNRGALAKCSFEETVEVLFQAATYAETDALRGVTENIILGQLAPFGTGACDILIDENKLMDAREADSMIATEAGASGLQGFLEGTSPYSESFSFRDDMTASPSPTSVSPPSNNPFSPVFNALSPAPTSPMASGSDRNILPMSPSQRSPTAGGVIPMSPTSPMYVPTSPMYTGNAMDQSMTSVPLSPSMGVPYSPGGGLRQEVYDPASPSYNASVTAKNILSPAYSPRSPSISPTSPAPGGMLAPMSPGAYSVTSPHYSPTSPFSPSGYDITSPLGPVVDDLGD